MFCLPIIGAKESLLYNSDLNKGTSCGQNLMFQNVLWSPSLPMSPEAVFMSFYPRIQWNHILFSHLHLKILGFFSFSSSSSIVSFTCSLFHCLLVLLIFLLLFFLLLQICGQKLWLLGRHKELREPRIKRWLNKYIRPVIKHSPQTFWVFTRCKHWGKFFSFFFLYKVLFCHNFLQEQLGFNFLL